MFKAVVRKGPQLVLLRSPPDTGKTSLAPALPELFPDQLVVFCCLARRVNLEVQATSDCLESKCTPGGVDAVQHGHPVLVGAL